MAYANFWGYEHVLWEAKANADKLGRRPPAWGKLLALRQALEEHEYALYLDMDLAIVQPMLHLDGFIEQLERSGRDLLVSQDGNGVNTGVMLFRRSPWSDWFLGELWRIGEELASCDCIFYYEQRAFHHALQVASSSSPLSPLDSFMPAGESAYHARADEKCCLCVVLADGRMASRVQVVDPPHPHHRMVPQHPPRPPPRPHAAGPAALLAQWHGRHRRGGRGYFTHLLPHHAERWRDSRP